MKFRLKLVAETKVPAHGEIVLEGESIDQITQDLGDILEQKWKEYHEARSLHVRANYVGKPPKEPMTWDVDTEDINPDHWDAEIEEWEEVDE